jgi:DNA-binding LytR/AlgR family response regulator
MKLQCMIVDDEPHALSVLESYVQQVSHLDLVARCANAIEAFEYLQGKKIDIIFLDIKMPGISGIEFIRSLLDPPKIIFTTAYREYAIEGYDLDVVDYLLKPISFDRFLRAIAKVSRQDGLSLSDERGKQGDMDSQHTANKDAFLYFKVDRSMAKIIIEEIIYVESAKDYARFFLAGNKSLLVRQSISSLENILSGHRFVRTHRSFIVAVHRIDSFTPVQVVTNGIALPIGRFYRNHVMQVLHAAGL